MSFFWPLAECAVARLGGSFCLTLKLPSSRSAPGGYTSPLFLQRFLCSSWNQNISPPSGCRKCLWPNSGGLFRPCAGGRWILKFFMASADLPSRPFPEVRQRIVLTYSPSLTFLIFYCSVGRIVSLYKENNTFSKNDSKCGPNFGLKHSVLNITKIAISAAALSKSNLKR